MKLIEKEKIRALITGEITSEKHSQAFKEFKYPEVFYQYWLKEMMKYLEHRHKRKLK